MRGGNRSKNKGVPSNQASTNADSVQSSAEIGQASAMPTEADGDGTAEAVKTKVGLHADRTLQLDTCQPSLASLSTDINDIKETLKAVLAQSSQITEVNKLLKNSEDKLNQYLEQTRLLKDNVTRIETRLVRVEEYIRSDKENKPRELRQKNIII